MRVDSVVRSTIKNILPNVHNIIKSLVVPDIKSVELEQTLQKMSGLYGEVLVNVSQKETLDPEKLKDCLSVTRVLSDVLGNVDETRTVNLQTAKRLEFALKDWNGGHNLIPNLPNEHCAQVLCEYFERINRAAIISCKDNIDPYNLVTLGKGKDGIKELVKILESHKITDHLKKFENHTLWRSMGYEKLKECSQMGLGVPRPEGGKVFFYDYYDRYMPEWYKWMKRNPQHQKDILAIYNSKLFAAMKILDFTYDGEKLFKTLDLSNLSKIDGMIELDKNYPFKYGAEEIANILKLNEEALDRLDKRNLLRIIPNRHSRISYEGLGDLLEVDDNKWGKIVERGLLEDMPGNGRALAVKEIDKFLELDDMQWKRLKESGLFAETKESLEHVYEAIVCLPENDYKTVLPLVDNITGKKNIISKNAAKNILNACIVGDKNEKPILSKERWNYTQKFAILLENENYRMSEYPLIIRFLKINSGFDKLEFDKKAAQKAIDFIVQLKKEHEDLGFINKIMRSKGVDNVFLSSEDLDAKIKMYNFLKQNFPNLTQADKYNLIACSNSFSEKFTSQFQTNDKDTPQKIQYIFNLLNDFETSEIIFLENKDVNSMLKMFFELKKMVKAAPEKYVNGNVTRRKVMEKEVFNFFKENKKVLNILSAIYDKETLTYLLRKRFEWVEDYFEKIKDYGFSELELLKKLSSCRHIDGTPLLPSEKLEFVDMIKFYSDLSVPNTDLLNKFAQTGKVDFDEIRNDQLNIVMKLLGLTEQKIKEAPKENMQMILDRLKLWDKKYVGYLASAVKSEDSDKTFSNLVRAANFEPNFLEYIHKNTNKYGAANEKTAKQFKNFGWNYENWIRPSKALEIQFCENDESSEKLRHIGCQIIEDIETLRKTPVKSFIDKNFSQYINEKGFVIPEDIFKSKAKLKDFTNGLLEQLETVWKRAKSNLSNPEKSNSARNTLTIYDHLIQRIKDLNDLKISNKKTNGLDLTIKMWDRIPQKDIFQGNYATCCIGIGNSNDEAMPHYLLNTAFNMIELKDNKTGKIIGNALCYFTKRGDGKTAFILDNIEINNAYTPSKSVGVKLRNSIAQYASQVAKSVTGEDDVPVYLGNQYNDLPYFDLKQEKHFIKFIGKTDCFDVYLDAYGGWCESIDLNSSEKILRLK